jgi:protein-L-isoaspartate(D-aspartate) O-methyltransferase
MTVEEQRRFYAEEIGAVAGLHSPALLEAFARVPREHFLGPGPWRLGSPDFGMQAGLKYRVTEDADPRRLYHNILVSIDPERNLNNGHPSTLAAWLDAVDIAAGERMFHLGCGLGYYTAVMAEVSGVKGHITALEVDAGLAARARENLAPWTNVEVLTGDGGVYDPGPADVIFVNAGVTHPRSVWLDHLRPGGRLLVPLTFDVGGEAGKGGMLLVQRESDAYTARFLTWVMIFSCTSVRDPELNGRLLKLIGGGKMFSVRSLRRDAHAADETCWLHGQDFCLSTTKPALSFSRRLPRGPACKPDDL